MEEKAGNYKEYSNHFCLTEVHVRKFHAVMEEYAQKLAQNAYVSIYVERENDSFYETRDLEKIISDENSSGKTIQALGMSIVTALTKDDHASSEKDRSKALINFSKLKDEKIRLMTSANSRDWCFLLMDELDTQVQRVIKSKSTSIFRAKLLDLVVALSLFVILLSGVAGISVTSQYDLQEILAKSLESKVDFLVSEEVHRHNTKSLWFIPGIAITMLFFLFILEFKPITKLVKASNMSVFYWGDVVAAYDSYLQKRVRIKWGIVIAFIVSLAASFVASFLL